MVKAKVTSAVALPAVDESLIGGAVIDAGDVVIDGSIRGKLGRLEAALAH